jgi:hypothetical protein
MKKKPEKISKFDRPAYVPPKRFVRPGSMDVLAAPSRIHNTLFYPDGTTAHDNQAHGKNNRNP